MTNTKLGFKIETNLDMSQRIKLARALDMLGGALADHGHQWTDGERSAYEDAMAELKSIELSDLADKGAFKIEDHGDHYRIQPFHRGERDILNGYAESCEHVSLKGTGAGSARQHLGS